MKVKINEELQEKFAEISIEMMDNVKTTGKFLNTITLEGLTLMLQKLRSNVRSQVVKDMTKNYIQALTHIVNRSYRGESLLSDEYEVKCMVKTFLLLVHEKGCLSEIYHFSDKKVNTLRYSDDYHEYVALH